MKTQDKIKYSIRFNNLTDDQKKSLSLLLHTRIEDIKNEILLFQDGKNSTLEISNLDYFFNQKIKQYEFKRRLFKRFS